MLGKLFKRAPKWQHQDEQVRGKAVAQMGAEDSRVLRQIAESDPSVEVRLVALARIGDSDYLIQLLTAGTPLKVKVKEAAAAKLAQLLIAQGAGQGDPASRFAALMAAGASEVVEQLAQHSSDPQLRQAALQHLTNEPLLYQLISSEKLAGLRLVALERIHHRDLLDSIYKEQRKRDKPLARRAKEKIALIDEENARPQRLAEQADDIIRQLAKLGLGRRWEQDDAKLDYLKGLWQQLSEAEGGPPDAERSERFHSACERYHQASLAYHQVKERETADARQVEDALAQRQPILDQLEQLSQQVDQAGSGLAEEVIQGFRQRLASLRSHWEEELDPLPGGFPTSATERYASLCATLGQQLDMEIRHREAATVAAEQCQRLEREFAQAPSLHQQRGEAALDRLRSRIDSLPKGAREALSQRFKTLEADFHQRCERQQHQAKELVRKLPQWLSELEREIEAGHSREASQAYQRIEDASHFFERSGQSSAPLKETNQRLKELRPRFEELRNWRDWAVVNERQRLCEEMETLAGLQAHPSSMIDQIKALQDQWKRLDATKATASQELWSRFKAAADRAYEPVKGFRQEQAEERRTHAQQRQEFLDQLAAYLEHIDWSHVDWKELQQRQRQARNQWREFGQVSHADWTRLNQAFQDQMERFNERLEPERQRCLKQRIELIETIERLAESDDIAAAIEQTKTLQKTWNVTVAGRKGEENALWKRFRGASEAVFERLREQRKTAEAELEQNLTARKQLCDQLEADAMAFTEADTLRAAIHGFEEHWRQLGEVPRPAQRPMDERYNQLLVLLREQARQLDIAARVREEQRLLELSAVCLELERQLSQPADNDPIEALEQRWQAARGEDGGNPLHQRHAEILAALGGDQQQRSAILKAVEDNQRTKAELCLRMEILAAVDSPPEAAQARMAFQVDRLNEAMRDGRQDRHSERQQLIHAWGTCGYAGPAEEALTQRFQRASDHYRE